MAAEVCHTISVEGEEPPATSKPTSIQTKTKMSQLILANSNFTVGSGFAKGKSFTVGQRVTYKFYARLESNLKRRFTVTEAKANGRTLYTLDEQLLAIEIYLENVDSSGLIHQDQLFAFFNPTFPERSYNSFIKLLYAIRSRDTAVPQQGLTTISTEVAEALHAYDSERFPLNEAEILTGKILRQIRG